MNDPGVLHIITGLETGGAERALFNILQGGLLNGHTHSVISLSGMGSMGPQLETLGLPVYALGMRRGWPSFAGLKALRRIIRQRQPDVIQGWMYHGNLAATLAHSLATKRPALAWNIRHSLYDIADEKPMTRQVIRLNRFFSHAPDMLLYNSRLSRQQHERFGFSSKRAGIIPNGIDLRAFDSSSGDRARIRAEVGIKASAVVVGHVARFHPMKDHATFIRAAMGIASRYPEVHFLLIGRDVSLSNRVFTDLLPEDVRERFHLLGERRDIPALMSAMDIFCQSSWSEAFPNVLGEAMASGIPCVATEVGDSALIVGDTGTVVPARDAQALARAMEDMLLMPLAARRALGERARQHIKDNFTLESIVDKYAVLYERLAASEPGSP